ncbi:MSMEG_1061 family FMN-dependent PPOX-type flavoprotein [Paenibacillus sabuli]|uniref:MSMEG_1061 family FMN-dependent PPOX-type flavoprotein n=1 Tax=Paenibacillus sabuli TaxID=2772509 RepID=UPI00295B991E|nr:MSMEG_1061 family FMN-dependent PPOX-type flavoprotein [Paenibacillus sabuli]
MTVTTDRKYSNDARITSKDELRELIGMPHEAVVKKTIDRIDAHVRHYLTLCPLFLLATSDSQGRCDVSPRGDGPGFVRVLDERTLFYPERTGNRRVDSLMNMLDNPQVGMLLLIPGLQEVVRINGRAELTKSEELLQGSAGKHSGIGVVVRVEEVFVHCPRALKFSGIWNAGSWPDKEALPSIADMFRAHLQISGYVHEE